MVHPTEFSKSILHLVKRSYCQINGEVRTKLTECIQHYRAIFEPLKTIIHKLKWHGNHTEVPLQHEFISKFFKSVICTNVCNKNHEVEKPVRAT